MNYFNLKKNVLKITTSKFLNNNKQALLGSSSTECFVVLIINNYSTSLC